MKQRHYALATEYGKPELLILIVVTSAIAFIAVLMSFLRGLGMPKGTVKHWNLKGYGFIQQDGAADDTGIFFHIGNVIGDFEPNRNDRVEFDLRDSSRKPGSVEAVQVRLLD